MPRNSREAAEDRRGAEEDDEADADRDGEADVHPAEEKHDPDGGERDAAGAGLRIGATERLTVDVGLRSIRETVGAYSPWTSAMPFGRAGGLTGGFATGAGGGALGSGQQPLDPLTGLPVLGSSGAQGEWSSSLPVGTELESDTARIGLGYRRPVGAVRVLLAAGDGRGYRHSE